MAGWLKRRFAEGVPLSLFLSGLVMVFTTLFACLIAANAWRESAELARAMADRAFAAATLNVKIGLENRLLPLQALVDLGATLETGAAGFGEEVRILTPFFIGALDAHRTVLALNRGTVNGNFFAAVAIRNEAVRRAYKAPEGTAYVLWRIEEEAGGRRMDTREFRTLTYTLIETRKTEAAYDPRERPWYREAVGDAGRIMTEPYVFTTAGEVGIACARAAADRTSVFSINILLGDVNDMLASVPVSPHGLLLLLDKNERPLAQSGSAYGWRKELFARPLAEHPDPRVRALAAHLAAHSADAAAHEIGDPLAPGTFLNRTEIMFGTRRLDLVIAAPSEDFTSVTRPFFRTHLGYALALLALFMPLAAVFARRAGRSLSRLAEAVGRDGECAYGGLAEAAASPVLEVRRVARALLRLETALRDRTSRLIALQDGRPPAADGARDCFGDAPGKPDPLSGHAASPAGPAPAAPFRAGPLPEEPGDEPMPDNRETPPRLPQAASESGAGVDPSAGRVLLAESDAATRRVAADLLDAEDLRLDVAEDGLEAVEKAWVGGYDLLLVGERLPGMGGRDVARLLRLETRLDAMPILLLVPAAGAAAEGAEDGPEAGAPVQEDGIQDRLATPIRPDAARVTVRRWIETRRRSAAGGVPGSGSAAEARS